MDLSTFLQTISANSNITIQGITVSGTETIVNTTDLLVEDNKVVLNSTATGTPILNASLIVNRGSSANTSIVWNENLQKWQQTRDGSFFVDLPFETNELRESSTNLYFTTARVNSVMSTYTGNLSAGNAALGNTVSANYIVGNVAYNNLTGVPILKVSFNYNDATPSLVGIIPANAVVSKVEIIVTTPFNNNSNATITLGTTTHPTELVDTTDSYLNSVGIYTTLPGITYMSDTHVLLTINSSSSTAGSGMLNIYY